MLSTVSKTVLICLGVVVVTCYVTEAAEAGGSEYRAFEEPQAEERTFKGAKQHKLAPLVEKKNWLLSFFGKSPGAVSQTVHTLAPLEQFPIWKVHKYKGIELRPVQVVDIPTSYEYTAEPETVVSVEPPRAPHTEYGTPATEYGPPGVGAFSFNPQPSELFPPFKEEPVVPQLVAPQPSLHELHAAKLRTILGALKSHKNLFRKLKNWKLGLKHPVGTYGLPEVAEIPLKGFENLNLQVPELPAINLPQYTSTVSAGPYLRVQYGSPFPAVNYGVPTPSYSVYAPSQTYPPQVPAPYYGAPPLFDSYGSPLPPDAYSLAPSEQVPTFALPESPVTSHHEVKDSTTTPAFGDVPQEQELVFVKQAQNATIPAEKETQITN